MRLTNWINRFAVVFTIGTVPLVAEVYNLVVPNTNIEFKVKHLGISNVNGNFEEFTGSIKYDEKSGILSDVDVTIKTESITTSNAKRDEHLRSPDFFNAAKNPQITFKSKSVKNIGKEKFAITGVLNMNGIEKEITFDAVLNGKATSPWGQKAISFSAETKIQRKDFGLMWNKALEAGGFLVGEEVKILLEVEANLAAK